MFTLSTPTPARPITRSFFAFSRSSGVTLVALRTTKPSASAMSVGSEAAVRHHHVPAGRFQKINSTVANLVCNQNFHAIKRKGWFHSCQMGPPRHVFRVIFSFYKIAKRGTRMSYLERIQADLVAAMKAKDELRLSVVAHDEERAEAERSGQDGAAHRSGIAADPADSRKAAQRICRTIHAGRAPGFGGQGSEEITIIESYLPAAPSDADMERAIAEACRKPARIR